MKLLLIGRTGSRACDWSGYALLDDNHAQTAAGRDAAARLSALSAVRRAAHEGPTAVDAARLREEVVRAWQAVLGIPLDRAIVIPKTPSTGSQGLGGDGAESAYGDHDDSGGPRVDPLAAARVVTAAKGFVTAVLELTEDVEQGETLEVRLEDAGPAAEPNRKGHSLASAGHGLARLDLKPLRER